MLAAAAALLSAALHAEPLPDPTLPSLRGEPGEPVGRADTGLTWTRVTEKQREAVINGVTVTEGQQLGDMHIQRIRHGEVVVVKADRRVTLRLSPAIIERADER